jgi:hypothetical protein
MHLVCGGNSWRVLSDFDNQQLAEIHFRDLPEWPFLVVDEHGVEQVYCKRRQDVFRFLIAHFQERGDRRWLPRRARL